MSEKPKKYVLFSFQGYYPFGGMADMIGSFDEVSEAMKAHEKSGNDFAQIVDRDSWEVVWKNTLF